MMKSTDKLRRMHEHYGRDHVHECRDCRNYIRYKYHGRTYGKCAAYGVSHSDATDWSGRYAACGLFGRGFDPKRMKPVIELYKGGNLPADVAPMAGQVEM